MKRVVFAIVAILLFGLLMAFVTPAIGLRIEGSQTSKAIYSTLQQLFGVTLYLIVWGSGTRRARGRAESSRQNDVTHPESNSVSGDQSSPGARR